ncbi:MAG: DUF1501 domain-containing protein [Bacteroidota bacterium]
MCNEKHSHTPSIHKKAARHLRRKGTVLAHGHAHEKAHRDFGRRDFLRLTGLAALGSSLQVGKAAVQPFLPNAFLNELTTSDCGDRILVLVRLKGGNDGLNTIIQRGDDTYYNIRPTLAIPESDLWGLNDAYGMPNYMQALQPFWEEGNMQVVHNVGYPDANYSHFRSSDIWASASDSDVIDSSGWLGRLFEQEFQAFASAPPVVPPALQIGVQTNMIFRSLGAGSTALSISNPQEFYQIALNGELYDANLAGTTPKETELKFVRSVANSAFRYSESIRDAYNGAINQADYPAFRLSEEMAIVARLIKGQLGSKVYMVTIGGFDTHSGQVDTHPELLQAVAESISAFYTDLRASGHASNVLTMTFSEFGRTIYENGSFGTDHGTGAPMLLFGEDIGSGFQGESPDLDNVDYYGDPFYSVDFRSVYGTVLQNWLCVDPALTDNVLGQSFDLIPDLLPPSATPPPLNNPAALLGHNPGPEVGTLDIKYSIKRRGAVRLSIHAPNGTMLRLLVDEFQDPNSYTFRFRPSEWLLPAGQYRYRLATGGRLFERKINW